MRGDFALVCARADNNNLKASVLYEKNRTERHKRLVLHNV